MRDQSGAGELSRETGASNVVGGTVGGAAAGAVLGGIAGLVASFIIPGLGAFFIGGPLSTTLGLSGAAASTASGAATGLLAGGILGALTSAFGMTNEEAKVYESRINEGGILVAVPSRMGEEEEVKAIMLQFDADNVREMNSRGEKVEELSSVSQQPTPAYMHEVRGVKRKG